MNYSLIHGCTRTLGQYSLYRCFLELMVPEHLLYLAISHRVYNKFFTQKAVQVVVQRYQLALLIVDVETEEILEWKN
jgi:hypothetical protein